MPALADGTPVARPATASPTMATERNSGLSELVSGHGSQCGYERRRCVEGLRAAGAGFRVPWRGAELDIDIVKRYLPLSQTKPSRRPEPVRLYPAAHSRQSHLSTEGPARVVGHPSTLVVKVPILNSRQARRRRGRWPGFGRNTGPPLPGATVPAGLCAVNTPSGRAGAAPSLTEHLDQAKR